MAKYLGSTLLAVTWCFTTWASILVALRLYCRIQKITRFWWDDFWICLSLMFSWAMAITWTVYTALGATSYSPLSRTRQIQTSQINWISQVWCILALITGKLAIAALIARLQSPCRWRSMVLWVVSVISVAWGFSEIILIFAQCRPVTKLWDQSVEGHCLDPKFVVINSEGASCETSILPLDHQKLMFWIIAYWAFLDLLLAALPVQMVWKLQMSFRKKILLCCLLSTGVFAFAIAVVKITMLRSNLDRSADFIKLSVGLFIWNAVEINVVIVAGCIPTITPLLPGFGNKNIMSPRPSEGSSERTRKAKATANWFDRSKLFSLGTQDEEVSRLASQSDLPHDEKKGPMYQYNETSSSRMFRSSNNISAADDIIQVTRTWHVTNNAATTSNTA